MSRKNKDGFKLIILTGIIIVLSLGLFLNSCDNNLMESVEKDVLAAGPASTFRVIYDGNGNTGGEVPVDLTEYKSGDTVTVLNNVNKLVKTGNSFLRWNTKEDGTGTYYSQGPSLIIGDSDVILYAMWTTENVYNVVYNTNGGNGIPPLDSLNYLTGDTVSVLGTGTVERSRYVFTSWNKLSDGSGLDYSEGDTFFIVSSDVTLYAQWEPIYTIIYDGNGNTAGSVSLDSTNYKKGETATVLDNTGNLERTGFYFNGWNTQSDGNGDSYSQGDPITIGTEDITLFAVWIPTYTVFYDGNGNTSGSVPLDSINYKEGETATVLENTGTLDKTGFYLNGWNTQSDGNGDFYSQGDPVTIGTSDITLFAVWTLIPTYIVSYDANNATGGTAPSAQTKTQNVNLTLASNSGSLVRNGYTFTGWNTAADGSGSTFDEGATYTVNAALSLYAEWMLSDITSPHIGLLKLVPAGSFQRDSTSTDISVITSAFRISEKEITQDQYLSVTGDSPSDFTGITLPVEMVTWYDAVEFCNKLSVLESLDAVYTITSRTPSTGYPLTDATVTVTWTNNGYRLPTEMEWMWAAMGAVDDYSKPFAGSNGSNSIGDYAWYDSNSDSKTHPAGTKLSNELGLYDMSGNVWEWCWDWYAAYPGGTLTDFRGAVSGSRRVKRGGGWHSDASYCTVAYRYSSHPDYQYRTLGFRVVRP